MFSLRKGKTMLYIIENIIHIIALLWLGFCCIGYILYRSMKLERWTDGLNCCMEGMKKIICAGIQLCEAVLNEFGFQQETIRPELVLTNQEILDLIDKLNGCPYDVPSLDDYEPNASGILWVNISAIGLAPAYQQITEESIKEIASKIIQKFYMRSRETSVPLYIKVATKQRLYFAIALSEKGKKFLDKQEEEKEFLLEEENIDLFTEEIPEEENSHDFRI